MSLPRWILALVVALFAAGIAPQISCGEPPTSPPDSASSAADGQGGTADAANPGNDAGTPVDSGSPLDAGTVPPDAGNGGSDGGSSPTTIRFAAMGDTGKGNTGQSQVAAAVQQKCAASGCDFVLLLGDNIYDSGVTSATDPQFQAKFEVPYANVNLPFWAVLGNHDYGGNGAGNEFAKGQYEVDYTQNSTKWKMPAKVYRHLHGNTEFFALDSNMQMYGQDAQQKTDVAAWIAASTATWKIAVGHHPYLSNGPHGNAGSYDGLPFIPIANGKGVKDFMEQVICGKVDLYLCGHDHNRQWLTPTCNGTELLVSGAGASTTNLSGTNPTRFQSSTLGFLYVVIQGRTLSGSFLEINGTLEFTRTLTK